VHFVIIINFGLIHQDLNKLGLQPDCQLPFSSKIWNKDRSRVVRGWEVLMYRFVMLKAAHWIEIIEKQILTFFCIYSWTVNIVKFEDASVNFEVNWVYNSSIIVCSVAERIKASFFTTTVITIAWSLFSFHPRRVVASLDKALYDNYLTAF